MHAHTAEKDALRKQVQQAKEMMEATVEEMKHRDAKIAELQVSVCVHVNVHSNVCVCVCMGVTI